MNRVLNVRKRGAIIRTIVPQRFMDDVPPHRTDRGGVVAPVVLFRPCPHSGAVWERICQNHITNPFQSADLKLVEVGNAGVRHVLNTGVALGPGHLARFFREDFVMHC